MALHRGSPQYKAERNLRLQMLKKLQEEYPTRRLFVQDVINHLYGCSATPMQVDILDYMDENKTGNYMIQASRGEGKTILTSINAVFELIHDPTCRVAIFSGNDDVASEISGFIYQLFHSLPMLEFMLPDRRLGDSSSKENFSVCGYLKGTDKSPSVRCRPIFGGFQGIRADKIIADDVEMLKNSHTADQRDKLRQAIQELESLLDGSKQGQQIIVLGTPQSTESVYNVLPSLGFKIRIWTARVPAEKDYEHYGDMLAPYVQKLYENPTNRTGCGLEGNRGIPCDPQRYDEEVLCKKEQIQSLGGMFDLQYMLCTRLADADRYPLKPEKLLFMDLPENEAPLHINTIRSAEKLIKPPLGFSLPRQTLYEVMGFGGEMGHFESTVMYIDPSGGGTSSRDELAYSVVKSLNGNVFVDRVGGMQGGYCDDNLDMLCDIIGYYWSLNMPLIVYVEDNYSNGMFREMLQSRLKNKHIHVQLEGDHVTGQKEVRIIGTMLPLLNSNRLIFNRAILESDVAQCNCYGNTERTSYSLFHQMKYITSERKSLKHDDRLDSLAGALKFFADALITDQQETLEQYARDAKIARIRKVFPRTADTILKNLGWVDDDKCKGINHTNFGKFKRKQNNGKHIEQEKSYRNPWEKERDRKISEARINGEPYKGRTGSHSNFYGRRKEK